VDWDHSVDVLVMGSGGAGQCAALRASDLGLDVLVVEKGDTWGGSTAMSGGAVWLPNNRAMKELGLQDSEDEGVKYMTHLTGGTIPEERIRTFIHEGNRMIDYLEARTHVRFDSLETYPDYVPEDPGGALGGRSLDPVPFDGTELGEAFRTLHDPYPPALIMGKFLLTVPQARTMLQPGLKPKLEVAKGMARYAARRNRRKRYDRDPFLTMGQSLMGRFRLSLVERGVPLWLNASVQSFVKEGDRIVGVTIMRDDKPMSIEARRGVMVAAGGFERNDAMRKQYQRAPIEASWTVGNYDNTGDGILAGEAVGAQLDVELMREAWWMPATLAPGVKYTNVLMIEKSLPHGIFVNRDAKRFLN
jgi:3-oxosteroid 1-dehydrogenase